MGQQYQIFPLKVLVVALPFFGGLFFHFPLELFCLPFGDHQLFAYLLDLTVLDLSFLFDLNTNFMDLVSLRLLYFILSMD